MRQPVVDRIVETRRRAPARRAVPGAAAPPRTLTADSQLMQDYLETAGILVNPDGAPAMAAFQNPNGETEAIVLDVNGHVCHVCRESLSDSGWNMFGIGAGFSAIGAVDSASVWALGQLDASFWQGSHGRWTHAAGLLASGQVPSEISVGIDGTVWAIDDTGAVYAKGASTSQGAPPMSASAAPVAVRDAAGLLHVFCIDASGNLWTIGQEAPGGAWGNWTALNAPAGVVLTALAAAPTPGNGLDVFALASSGTAVWCIGQPGPGQPWNAWGSIGVPTGASLGTMTFALDSNARPQVFANDASGQIWNNAQTLPGGGWTGWQSLGTTGLNATDQLTVAAAANGALVLFVSGVGFPAPLASIAQTGPGGGWGQWSSLGSEPLIPKIWSLAVGLNQDGCLDVFALENLQGEPIETGVWHCTQQAPNGSWGSWSPLGAPEDGMQLGPIAVGQNADGRLELFATGSDGALWHCWQGSPGSDWSDWASLTAPGTAPLGQIAVTRDQTGCLEVFGLDSSPTLWLVQQMSAGNGWGTWVSAWWAWCPLGAPAALAHAPSGRADDFWAVATSGALARWSAGAWSTVAAPPAAPAAWVAVGADGTVWVLATNGVVYQYVNGAVQALPGSLAGVAYFSASDGTNLWATAAPDPADSQAYALFRYDGGTWRAVEAPPLHGGWNPPRVSVAADGSVWVLDGSGAVWRMQSTSPVQWTTCGAPATSGYVASLTAAPAASAWAVDNAGGIWRYRGPWVPFQTALPNSALAQQVASGAPGTLWAIDTAGNPYEYVAASAAWQPVSALPALTVAPTTWALGKNGTIWQYASGGWTQLMHSLPNSIWPAQVAAAADGSVWALDIHGGLYQFSTADSAWVPVAGAPAGLVQVAVANASAMWGIAQDAADADAFNLYCFVDGAWQVVAGPPVMSRVSATPQVSVGPDGTVWVLDGDGIVRVVRWNPAASVWTARKAALGLQSISATGIDEAWAVAADGSFQRNFGSRWVDADAPLPLGVAAMSVSIGSDGTAWALDDSGDLYVMGAPVVPAAPTFGTAPGPAACLDGVGHLELFATDREGTLWTCREGAADGWWQGWLSLGTPTGVSVAGATAGLDEEGRVQVLAIGAGALWQRRQTTPGGGWGPWVSLGAPAGIELTRLAVAPNQGGRLQIFAIGADGGLYTVWETAPGVWSGWGVLSPAVVPIASVSAILRSDGTLAVIALGDDQAVHSISQTAPNDGWGSWAPLGTPAGLQLQNIAIGPNANGLLQVFAVGSDNGLYTIWETAPGIWSAWGPLVAPATSVPIVSVAAALDAQGLLHVLAVGSDQVVHQVAQTSPSNGWGSWVALGTPAGGSSIAAPLIVPDGAGALAAFVVVAGAGPGVWTIEQDDSAAGWGTWVPLASAEPLPWSPVAGAPALAQAPSGSASDNWAVNSQGTIVNWNVQQWSPSPLPGGAPAAAVAVGTDGSIWAVTTASGQSSVCYQYDNGAWQEAGSGDFAQAPAGRADDLWCVTRAGAICRSADGGNSWWEDTGLGAAAASVAVAADGTVWALDTAGSAWISSAWQRTMRPTGMSGWPGAVGMAVAAGQDANGLRYAFFTGANGELAYAFEVFRHTWTAPILLAQQGITKVGVTNQQDTGALIAYGISAESLLVASRAAGAGFYLTASNVVTGAWSSGGGFRPTSLADVELCAVDAATWYWLGLASIGFLGENSLVVAAGNAQGGSATFSCVYDPQNGTFPSGFTSIVRLPWPRPTEAPYAAVLDGNQNMQIISVPIDDSFGMQYLSCTVLGLTGQATALPTGVAAIGASWQAGAGLPPQPRFYATAPATSGPAALWVARLIDASLPVTEPTAWSNWIPLGGNYLSLCTGPAGLGASTVFGTSGSDTSLVSLSQDTVTGKWTALGVKRPSLAGDAIEPVTMYHTLVTLGDATGTVPQTGLPVTVTASSPVAIWVAGGVHMVDGSQGVTCATDASGALRIRTLATGLHTPQLTFEADGLPAGQSAYPPQHVHDFLAGSGQLAVGGGLPASFTADTLVGATVGGQPLSPNLTQSVAQQTVTWAGQITQMPAGASAAAGGPAGWAIDLSDRSRPVIETFADVEALGAYRARLAQRGTAPPGSIWSDIWHGVKHAAEDVVHAIENGVVAVDTIVVDTASKVVSLSLSIAGTVVGVFDMVVNTVEDAMRAIEALLATLIADIKMIIAWLELLFAWEDIWQTKETLEQFLGQALTLLGAEIGTAQAQIQGLVSTLERSLISYFDGLISTLRSPSFPYQTFGDLPSSATGAVPAGRARAAAAGSLPPVPGSSLVHYGWLLAKTLDHITPSFGLGSLGALSLTSLIDAIDVNNVLDDLELAVTELITYVTGVVADPSSFAEQTIVGFLEAARALLLAVLDALEDLLEAFLDVVQQVLAGIGGVFDHRLDIPVISALYELVTGLLGHREDLTVLHLCALLIAVPLTITYKLLNNEELPYSGIGLGTPRAGAGEAPVDAWKSAFMCTGVFFITPVVVILDGIAVEQGPEGGFLWKVPLLGALANVAAMVQQINAWPGMFPAPIEPQGEVAGWVAGNWGVYWGAAFVDLALTVALVKPNPALAIVKNICRTGFGSLAMATAAVAVGFAESASPPAMNGDGVGQEVVKPLPLLLSWMMIGPLRQAIFEATDGFDPAVLKLVADAASNLALPFLHEYA